MTNGKSIVDSIFYTFLEKKRPGTTAVSSLSRSQFKLYSGHAGGAFPTNRAGNLRHGCGEGAGLAIGNFVRLLTSKAPWPLRLASLFAEFKGYVV